MSKLSTRLAALEAERAPRVLRNFVTCDGVAYAETTNAIFDYHAAIMGAGGALWPGIPTITRAELDAIERRGPVLIVEWVDMSGATL